MRKDWVEVELREILLKLENGKRPLGGVSGIADGVPSIGGEHLNSTGGFRFEKIKFVPKEFADAMNKGFIEEEDILIVKDGATTGKVSYVGKDFPFSYSVINEHVFKCKLYSILNKKFVFYFLFGITGQKRILLNFKGSAQGGINTTFADNTKIPIAPLPEQRAIVSKIELLFSELDNAVSNLKQAKDKLEIFRQSVLKKAFEGELTKCVITNLPLSKFALLITKGSSPNWQGFDYISNQNELLFITSENVREGYLSLKKKKYLSLEFNKKQSRSILQKGDVLFNLVGASIGRAAIFNLDKMANINQAVSIIRLDKTLNNNYLNYFLNSGIAKNEYMKNVVEVARANLSLQDVNCIEIPHCSILEQQEIVKEIETRFSVADKLVESIEESLLKAEALRQSILKKAFEGELLSKAELDVCRKKADWEPAGKLLERINANSGESGTGILVQSGTKSLLQNLLKFKVYFS
ncbi:MAG: restriction endonuclease subunit S [Candidatus Delongbacteria bacterium]|nr:restriction endonuclease subunit S [Candidatus Delongbacteria bacterium]